MCADGWYFEETEVNGACSECGEDTVDGGAKEGCNYGPLQRSECGYRPCDGSC